MSLLRDLIYSQQTESDFAALIDPLVDDDDDNNDGDIQKAVKARGKERTKQINKRKSTSEFHESDYAEEDNDDNDDNDSVLSEDEKTGMRCIRTISNTQRRSAFSNRVKALQIYCNSPEIRFQTLPEVTRYYVPGFSGFLKFPQHKRSIIETNKDIVRNVWNSCYHAKDYEGACQALETLAKLQKLTTSELVMFTEMLRSSILSEDDESSSGGSGSGLIEVYLCLLQHCVARRVHKGNDTKRVELVQVFVELLLSPSVLEDVSSSSNETNRGNVDAAKNMLKAFLTEARIAKHPRIVCMNIMVHVMYVSVEASIFISSLGDKLTVALPSWKEISLCPMYFMQVVRVLYCIASSTSDVIYWEDRREQCIRLLKELDSVFQLCTIDSLIDIIELKASYYLGIGNLYKAKKSLKMYRNYILRSERNTTFNDVTVAANRAVYYRTLTRFFNISNRASIDSLADVSGFAQGVSLWLQNEQLLSAKKLNMIVLLYQSRFLSKESFLELLCSGIERSQVAPSLPVTMYGEHTELHCMQWMLWMLLANLLGQIHPDRRIDLTSPIHSSSDLFCLFSLRNDPTEEVSNNDETDAIRNSFCRERKWWYGKILSTSNLDDFVDSILSSDVDMLMDELQHIDPWDSFRAFDVLSDSNVCCSMWDSDHHSEGADDGGGCSLFEYEFKFESIFGPGWRLDFQLDNEEDDGDDDDDDDDGSNYKPSDRRDGEDDNDSDLSDPPSSDYQERIAFEDDVEEEEEHGGGITDNTARLERSTISSLCNLAREELFRSCPLRTDQATHFCCLRSRLTTEMNRFDSEADIFTTEVEMGDFLPTKQWQQKHLHETGQKGAGLVEEKLVFHRLSDRLLEMLAAKVVVCCHIQSQDCLFVVRAVQVLIQHCLPFYLDATSAMTTSQVTAKQCILYLHCMGVNVLRAADLAKHLALKEVPVCYQSAPVRAFSTDNVHNSNSFGQYRPI